MTLEVVFAPEAEEDLIGLYDYIAARAYPERAFNYVESIRSYCLDFVTFPERGTRRDELRPGLRTVGFRRRVTVAFHVTTERVVIDRILYAGRDIGRLFGDD